jgi:hypothetical protein
VLQGTENRELSICKNCDVHLQEIAGHLQGANVSLFFRDDFLWVVQYLHF